MKGIAVLCFVILCLMLYHSAFAVFLCQTRFSHMIQLKSVALSLFHFLV